MQTFAERLKKIWQDSGKLQPDFAESIQISERSFRNYRDNCTIPSVDVIAAISKRYDVNCDWLVLGEGPIYRDQTPAPQNSSQIKDTNINVLGVLHKTKSDNASTAEDIQRLLSQIAEMQKTILDLTATNRKLVEKLLQQ